MAQGAAWALSPPPRHAEADLRPPLPPNAPSPAGASDVCLPWLAQLRGRVLMHAARAAQTQNARDLHAGRARLEEAAGSASLFEALAPPAAPVGRPPAPAQPVSPLSAGPPGRRSLWGKRASSTVKLEAEAAAAALAAKRVEAGLARSRGFYEQLATVASLRPRGRMLVERSVSVAMVRLCGGGGRRLGALCR